MLVEPARPRAVREHPRAGWLAVATVCFGAFMGQLDASIVTLTFRAIGRQFDAPLAAVQWVSLSYLLTLVGLVVAAGRLADAAGRKLVYLYGFVVFTAGSAACGLATGLGWLVVFRVLQAVGAAMLQANSVALVVTSVPRERMRAALGVQAAAQALGLALGPTVGGLLVASIGWRWVFLVNVPIGCLALLAGWYLLPRTRERTPVGRFDLVGLLLLVVATACLLLALSGLSGLPVPGWVAVVLVGVSVLAAAGFVAWERRNPNALIDLSVLRRPPVSVGLVGALCGYLVLFGPLALFPQVLGDHSTEGFVLTMLPAGFAVAAVAADRVLPARWGPRARALSGAGTCVVAACGLAAVPAVVGLAVPLLFLMGVGLGVFVPANNSSIMSAVPGCASATGGGLVNMSRGLGTALGVAVVTLSLHAGGASTAGTRLAMGVMAVVALAAGATGLASRGANVTDTPQDFQGAAR